MGSRSQAASSTQLSARYTRATSRLEALATATLSLAASVSCIEIVVIMCILSEVSDVTSTGCTEKLLSRSLVLPWLRLLAG